MTNIDNILKKRDITLLTKVHIEKAMGFPVAMYGCESWTIKKAECQRSDACELLEKTLESSLDYKEIKPVNLKGNQPWIFLGRTDAETEAPVLWSPDVKSQLWKRPWSWERLRAGEKGAAEDELGGWHHRLNGHEFEQTLGNCEGQGSLMCCSSWGCRVSDVTKWLNNNKYLNKKMFYFSFTSGKKFFPSWYDPWYLILVTICVYYEWYVCYPKSLAITMTSYIWRPKRLCDTHVLIPDIAVTCPLDSRYMVVLACLGFVFAQLLWNPQFTVLNTVW